MGNTQAWHRIKLAFPELGHSPWGEDDLGLCQGMTNSQMITLYACAAFRLSIK